MNDATQPSLAEGAPGERRLERFSFTGTAGEYFGIWIVNILLTILTLGIYSAWAKVRRQRYFYGNTKLAGRSFDYHARPMQILIGRIVVLAALLVYNAVATFFPIASLVLLALLIAVTPWLIKRGLRFNARVTSYRNVRLDFHGGYWGALLSFVIGPALAAVTLGFLAPLASRWAWRYTLGNVSYGGRKMDCDPRLKALYGQWWLPAVMVLLGTALLGLLAVAVFFPFGGAFPGADLGLAFLPVAVFIALALIYGVAGLFYRAGVRNVAFNAAMLDGRHQFVSTLGRRRYAWISTTNFLATICTIGLARPWAAVRMARYTATATAVLVSGVLDDYLNQVEETGPAVGAEYMDVEGIDFGF
ncbi:YjgN family protein [Chelativorans sp. M5D2P16]|uniref:YjgN family protein n=1 Tax=Chelativorans sp. M5D2P16 TaxID=3095678 RepID=UPI002ACA060A|nr:DUF898 family protein [Chelativorans sp. M5D2P16]MDZ5699855.1 DUF898 family protein [Chelativorans sp. M5D2P16]